MISTSETVALDDLFQTHDLNIDDMFDVLTPHIASTIHDIISRLKFDTSTNQPIDDIDNFEFKPDPGLIRICKDLKIKLNVKFHNESLEAKLANSITIYFIFTSFFLFLKAHAVPLVHEYQKKAPDQKMSPLSQKMLQEAIIEEPENFQSCLETTKILEGTMSYATSSLTNFIANNCGPGRNSYFMAYWLCSELAKTLREFRSSKTVTDVMTILEALEKSHPQFFDDFPPLDRETIKQAIRRGDKLNKEVTQDTATGV